MSVAFVLYSTLVLYIKDMDGNPFLNFVFQSAAEFPSFLIGRYLSEFKISTILVIFQLIYF